MKIIKILLLVIAFIQCNPNFAQNDTLIIQKAPISIGENLSFHSKILNEERNINIYLPNGYSPDSVKTYPVIYVLDGSIDEDFIHLVGLVQFASFSWINMIPESIVVGISNIDRKRDFTYASKNKLDQIEFPSSGHSDFFIEFIEKELQPLVEKSYKVSSEKTIIGQSLGGLLATEILFKSPDLFDNYIVVSPSLWWDDEKLLKFSPKAYFTPKSIFIAVGKEGEIMERTAKSLFEKLNSKKAKNTSLYFEFLENQSHGDALHLAVYHAFEKIFKE